MRHKVQVGTLKDRYLMIYNDTAGPDRAGQFVYDKDGHPYGPHGEDEARALNNGTLNLKTAFGYWVGRVKVVKFVGGTFEVEDL